MSNQSTGARWFVASIVVTVLMTFAAGCQQPGSTGGTPPPPPPAPDKGAPGDPAAITVPGPKPGEPGSGPPAEKSK